MTSFVDVIKEWVKNSATTEEIFLLKTLFSCEANADLNLELIQMYNKGERLDAVKRCKAEIGLGLKDAKEYVERIVDNFNQGKDGKYFNDKGQSCLQDSKLY